MTLQFQSWHRSFRNSHTASLKEHVEARVGQGFVGLEVYVIWRNLFKKKSKIYECKIRYDTLERPV